MAIGHQGSWQAQLCIQALLRNLSIAFKLVSVHQTHEPNKLSLSKLLPRGRRWKSVVQEQAQGSSAPLGLQGLLSFGCKTPVRALLAPGHHFYVHLFLVSDSGHLKKEVERAL